MFKLIESLQIFSKYMVDRNKSTTACGHETLYVCEIPYSAIVGEDKERLVELGWFWDEEEDAWGNYNFGG